MRFETAPNQQAQFDFAEFGYPWGKRYAVLTVIGFSRFLTVEWVSRQTALTVMRALQLAFTAFGACRTRSCSTGSRR